VYWTGASCFQKRGISETCCFNEAQSDHTEFSTILKPTETNRAAVGFLIFMEHNTKCLQRVSNIQNNSNADFE
jgi:hypothetical protein